MLMGLSGHSTSSYFYNMRTQTLHEMEHCSSVHHIHLCLHFSFVF